MRTLLKIFAIILVIGLAYLSFQWSQLRAIEATSADQNKSSTIHLVLPSNPTGGPLWDSGASQFAQGNFEQAMLLFRQGALDQAKDAAWPQAEAVAWISLGKFDSALVALDRCAAIAALSAEAMQLQEYSRLERGFQLASSGDPWQARQLGLLAQAANPRNPDARLLIGYSYGMEGANEMAEKELSQLVSEVPDKIEAYPVLVQCALRRGDAIAGKRWLDALRALSPNHKDLPLLQNQLEAISIVGATASSPRLRVVCEGTCPYGLEKELLSVGETTWSTLGIELGVRPRNLIVIRIVPEASITTGWAEAVYDGQIRMPLPLARDATRRLPVLKHEMTHAFLAEAGAGRVPLWLNEGLAQWFSGERTTGLPNANTASWLDQLPERKQFMDLSAEDAELAYRYSLAVTSELIQLHGKLAIQQYLAALGNGTEESQAFLNAFGSDYAHFSARVRSRL